MTAPRVPKDFSLAPVAIGIDENLKRFRDLGPAELRSALALEVNRELDGLTRDERVHEVHYAAVRNVDLHGWETEITPDAARLRLSGGSVTLDLGLGTALTRFIDDDA